MKLLIFLKVALGYENLDAIPFPKDQSADHEFPPRLQRSPNMPFGHLRSRLKIPVKMKPSKFLFTTLNQDHWEHSVVQRAW